VVQRKVFPCACYGGIWTAEVWLHSFLNAALDGGEWSGSRPDRFIPGKKTPRHPLNRKLGGQKSRSGLSWEWKVIYHCRNCATIPPRSSSPGPNRYTEHSITAATSCMLLCFNDLIFCPKNLPRIVPLDTVFRFTVRQYVMPHVLAVGNLGFWKSLGCDSVTYVLYYLTFLTLR